MSRVSPDPSTSEELEDVRKYLQGVAYNVPGLLEEMQGTPDWRRAALGRVPFGQHPLYCGGAIVSHHMETFAAKFGFAMHFEITERPIGPDGAVVARWYSNADVLENKFPAEAWEVMGAPATLRQGTFHVADQFEYQWAHSVDGSFAMFLGAFRKSFAVLAFTTTGPRETFENPPVPFHLWRPGSLAVKPGS